MLKPITKAQIARIWASAHALGLDREMLYLLVPRGSIRAMTRREAAMLITHMDDLAAKRVGPLRAENLLPEVSRSRNPDPHAATPDQCHFIYFLFGRLGWLENPARVRGFLRKYAGVPTVEEIADRKRASAIIEALKAIHGRLKAGTQDVQRN